MKKAWEITNELIRTATPRIQQHVEAQWEEELPDFAGVDIADVKMKAASNVPGSCAPERVLIGGIQATENMGCDVSEAEALIPELQRANEENDVVALLKVVPEIYDALSRAPKIADHPYWSYTQYGDFAQHEAAVSFPAAAAITLSDAELFKKLHAGWLSQIAGAAVGTMIEGYCTDKLREEFGEIREYIRRPTTYNDDVLFELAFLKAFALKGRAVTSRDVALEWVGRIGFAWSAEEVAYKNIKRGVFPPESARFNNPWREWIGAQMRASICGMLAPGDPREAARLAWTDGSVSHVGNGILGEAFNAMMVAMAFTESDIRTIVEKAVDLIPDDSEYYSVVSFALEQCRNASDWESAWRPCEEKYKRYNWIHTYPNAAAEVVSLWFGGQSFDECMHVCAMCGQDVDCNAGQIGTLYGVIQGYAGIRDYWTEPFADKFDSVFRGYEHTTITQLAQDTLDALRAADK